MRTFNARKFNAVATFLLCYVKRLIRCMNKRGKRDASSVMACRCSQAHSKNCAFAARVLDLQGLYPRAQALGDMHGAVAICSG